MINTLTNKLKLIQMKRFALLLLVVTSATVYAQKPVKPNLNKALASLQDGKLDEAKANIDAAIENDKMKGDGKTWYYRGLIYASIDTTSNEKFHQLDPNAFQVALESFEKAEALSKGKGYFTQDAMGLPVTKEQQMGLWANTHINKGANYYQEEDYDGALSSFEKVSQILVKDTIGHLYAGFAANASENYDKAIEHFTKYNEHGGTSSDTYKLLNNIYSGPKQDKEKALEVVREAKKKYPQDPDFPKLEIGMLIDLNRIDEAKSGLMNEIKKEPDNKILHFYLGYANQTLKDFEAAKKNYEDAIKIDPQYFDAQFYLARLMYAEAAALKKEMSDLGISAADKKKRFDLDKELVEKLKIALPYWEKAEKINPNDQDVLDALYSIYGDLDMPDQAKRIEKKYKELGYE
jgi:tetratricopeptide (TPR) repeat protein